MKTTDFIKTSLESGKNWLLHLTTDMKDAPLTQPTPNGGKAWVRRGAQFAASLPAKETH